MMKRYVVFCVFLLLALPANAFAYIEAMYTFDQLLAESTYIHVGKLEKVDLKARTALAIVERPLKGKIEFKRVQMNIGAGPGPHAEYLMERLKPGDDFIIFSNGGAAEVYTSEVWYQLYPMPNPAPADKESIWWRMNHVEIRFNRTYNGTVPGLAKLAEDVLAKRVKGPPPDPNVPPINIDSYARKIDVPIPAGKTGGFYKQVAFACPPGPEVRGIAFTDIAARGQLDVLFCRVPANVLLFNTGQGFQDQTAKYGIGGGARSAGWADWSAQGRCGLATSNFQLLLHTGPILKDQSLCLPPPQEKAVESLAWLDYNGDGLPDLLASNGPHGLRLWENTGRGPIWFRDVSAQAGFGPKGIGTPLAPTPGQPPQPFLGNNFLAMLDYDNDGNMDVLVAGERGLMLRNRGDGTFVEDTRVQIELPGGAAYKRGLAVGDYDNDGSMDVFVPGPKPRLYHNNNDGTFSDVTQDAGDLAALADASFSAAWGDANGDGLLDLVVCCPQGPTRLYIGNGRGQFADYSEALGVKQLVGAWSAAFADLSNRGSQDLLVSLPNRIVVAQNLIPRPGAKGSLRVRVTAQRGLVGAVVRAIDDRGRLLGMRQLLSAEGCGGQSPPTADLAVPVGTCRVTVVLSDGRAGVKTATIQPGHNTLDISEDELK